MALVRRGAARMVAVTLGAEGALLATDGGVLRMPAMDEPMHSSVGAGDAFLAAATLALARGGTPADALVWGTAAAPPPSRAPARQGYGGPMWRHATGPCAGTANSPSVYVSASVRRFSASNA